MAGNLCPDTTRSSIMVAASCFVLLVPSVPRQVGAIMIAALTGRWLFKPPQSQAHDPLPTSMQRRAGMIWLTLFFALLLALPFLKAHFRASYCPWWMPSIGLARWYSGAAMLCSRCFRLKWCLLAGSTMTLSWLDTESLRLFRARYLPLRPLSGPR